MSSMNKAILIGNLGADPEVRTTENGQKVANLRVATTERWNDKQGQPQSRTEWHRVIAWEKQAELCEQYLRKGRQVCVEGRIQSSEWEKEGVKVRTSEIVAQRIVFLGAKEPEGSEQASA